MDAPAWTLWRTRPCLEHIVEANLRRIGALDVYVPRYYDKRRKAVACLFPSYLFAQVPMADGLPAIRASDCHGRGKVVTVGDRPAKVPPWIVPQWRAREDHNELVTLPDADAHLRPGSRLRVTKGPLADLMGISQGVDGKGRVRLLLDALLGRAVTTTLDARLVEAA
jgi:transcription antitermination factor NusG